MSVPSMSHKRMRSPLGSEMSGRSVAHPTVLLVSSFIGLKRLFDDCQHVARTNGRARLSLQLYDTPCARRLQLVLHLHRFDNDDALTGLDRLALLDEYA